MTRFLISLLALLSVSHLTGQPTVLSLFIVAGDSGGPVANAKIQWSDHQSYTDQNGSAMVKGRTGDTVFIRHLAWQDTFLVIQSGVPQTISMSPRSYSLQETTITGRPLEVFAPDETNVFDYEWKDDKLYVLTYRKEAMFRRWNQQSTPLYIDCALLKIGTTGNILETHPLPDRISGFHQDPRGYLFVIGENYVYQVVNVDTGKITLIKSSREKFEKQLVPLIGYTQGYYFMDNYSENYPELSYYALPASEPDADPALIRTICDSFTMELFRACYKYLKPFDKLRALRMEQETGVDKEIYGAYMAGFQNSLYFRPVYAPLFCINDTVIIFDPYSGKIFMHEVSGEPVDSVHTDFDKNQNGKFAQQILLDAVQHKFYATYKKSGKPFLREIRPDNGETGVAIRFYYNFPEKIKIHNGRVYYLYRSVDSGNTMHLFAEPIGNAR